MLLKALQVKLMLKANKPDKIELTDDEVKRKVLALLQFARKAGQLVHGFEACKKNIGSNKLKLLLLTKDISENTKDRIMKFRENTAPNLPVREYGTQENLSAALGLPWTAVIGILDNNFAGKIVSYLTG
jgi:ribosomal protein L7Ae-like RNA K-turn-binding protein